MFGGPSFQRAKVVFGLARPISRRPDLDDAFIRSIQADFPVVATRQTLPAEAPLQVPHLLLQSTASRLAVSALSAEMEVGFYASYASDYKACRDYLYKKSLAVIRAWTASAEVMPSVVGVILNMFFSFKGETVTPVQHLMDHHLRAGMANPETVQDAQVKLALRVSDRYFVNVALSNLELRELIRPVFPGQALLIKAWEAELKDVGIVAELDVNNRLTAFSRKEDPTVTVHELDEIFALLDLASQAIPSFVETGQLQVSQEMKPVK